MFIFEKILSLSILSPLIIILILIYLGGKILIKYRKKCGILLILIGIGGYLTSCNFFLDPIFLKLEKRYPIASEEQLKEAEIYIMLGGGIVTSTPEGNVPTESAGIRVMKTVQYYNRYPKKIYISGGMPLQNRESESSVYKREMLALGVPEEDIIIEEQSRTTQENALYIKKMMREEGLSKALLITSAYHMARSMSTFNKGAEDLEFYPAPCNFIASQDKQKIFGYIPSYTNFRKFQIILWEYIGMIYYKIRY